MPKENVPSEAEKLKTLAKANQKVATMLGEIESWAVTQAPEEAVAQMALPYFEAESFEDMFQGSQINPREELMDVGLMVESVTFNKSDYSEGLPYYATFRGQVLDSGKEFVTNCGGWQTVVVGYMCVKRGWLPRAFCFHKADKPTGGGFFPINLLPWGDYEPF